MPQKEKDVIEKGERCKREGLGIPKPSLLLHVFQVLSMIMTKQEGEKFLKQVKIIRAFER